jgi:hypothetical protein
MDFLFHVPFFCTAAAVDEIRTVCFVNLEFRELKKLILNQVKRASHFVKIIVCPNCPNQLNVNRQYPIRAHCSIVTVLLYTCPVVE